MVAEAIRRNDGGDGRLPGLPGGWRDMEMVTLVRCFGAGPKCGLRSLYRATILFQCGA